VKFPTIPIFIFKHCQNHALSYSGLTHTMVDLLVIPATVGEFWIIGYLLLYVWDTGIE